MPTKYVAKTDIHYQSPSTGKNIHFEAGDVIPAKVIADWPGNALRSQMSRGRIETQTVKESSGRGKPTADEVDDPTKVSVAEVRKGIKDGKWTVEEVVAAEQARPEDDQRSTITDMEPEASDEDESDDGDEPDEDDTDDEE